MSTLHYISNEVDRRAYQAISNIRRLHNHKQQKERLERMKRALSHRMLREYHVAAVDVNHFIRAVNAGHFALESGDSLEASFNFADAQMQRLMRADEGQEQ